MVVDRVTFNLYVLEPGIDFFVLVPWDRTTAPAAAAEEQRGVNKVKTVFFALQSFFLAYEFANPASQIPSSIREGSVG